MTPIVEICIVVVTLAIVAMAVVSARLMIRLDALTRILELRVAHGDLVLDQMRRTAERLDACLDAADGTLQSVRRGVIELERLVTGAGAVGATVADLLDHSRRRASALWRGLEAGVDWLVESRGRTHPSISDPNKGARNG